MSFKFNTNLFRFCDVPVADAVTEAAVITATVTAAVVAAIAVAVAGRGREDDGVGGERELIFIGIILENVGQVFVS